MNDYVWVNSYDTSSTPYKQTVYRSAPIGANKIDPKKLETIRKSWKLFCKIHGIEMHTDEMLRSTFYVDDVPITLD